MSCLSISQVSNHLDFGFVYTQSASDVLLDIPLKVTTKFRRYVIT